jgi:hypothetical protein
MRTLRGLEIIATPLFEPTAPHPAFGHLLPARGEKGNELDPGEENANAG